VLFPIRIDNAVMSTAEPWAVKLRDQRNIGDFRQWKKPAEYQKSLERLLRDSKASCAKQVSSAPSSADPSLDLNARDETRRDERGSHLPLRR
jgi:hypothetical protein